MRGDAQRYRTIHVRNQPRAYRVETHIPTRGGIVMSDHAQLQPTVVRLPVDMHRAVRERSARDDRTMAQTIRRAVKQYLATEN